MRKNNKRHLAKHRRYSIAAINKALSKASKAHNLPHWHPHQLRHLAATRLAKIYGLEITKILLGHADMKTTLRYVDPGTITPDDRNRYADAIAAAAAHG